MRKHLGWWWHKGAADRANQGTLIVLDDDEAFPLQALQGFAHRIAAGAVGGCEVLDLEARSRSVATLDKRVSDLLVQRPGVVEVER